MGTFRKGSGSSPQSGKFVQNNLVLKKGSKYTWIDSYLKEGATTRFRVLPSFDPETGEEDLALNPEALPTADPDKNFEEIFGQVIYRAELTDGIGSDSACFISGCREDAGGNPIPGGWSPAKCMLRRLRYKLEEAELLRQSGQQSDIPPAWNRWVRNPSRVCKLPAEILLMQVMAQEINGEVKQDIDTGKPGWVAPAIYPIPRSAQALFIQDAMQRSDGMEDLTLDNNLFGDFCSCENGHMILVRKIPAAGEGKNNTYNLKIANKKSIPIATARAYVKPWDEILDIPTVEDVIAHLVQSFDGIAVDYGLRGHATYAQYIPEAYQGSSDGIEDCANLKDLRAKLAAGHDEPTTGQAGQAPGGFRQQAALPAAQAQSQAAAERQSYTPPPRRQRAEDTVIDVPPGDFTEDADRFDSALANAKKRFRGADTIAADQPHIDPTVGEFDDPDEAPF